MMEERLANHLRHFGEADANLQGTGRDPEPFVLVYSGGMTREILHPTWDNSVPAPVASDIDDLEELGFLRVEPASNAKRIFALTVKGREQAAVLSASPLVKSGGRAPTVSAVLKWLLEREEETPEVLDLPSRIVPQAIAEKFVNESSREAFANRIVDLHAQDYLEGDLPEMDQISAEHRLSLSDGLRLTMKAHHNASSASTASVKTVNFNGAVIAGQIAAGDIRNYVSFGDVLDGAQMAIERLQDVSEDEKEEALGLIDVLRGGALAGGAEVITGAGGALLGGVIAQLLGLAPVA